MYQIQILIQMMLAVACIVVFNGCGNVSISSPTLPDDGYISATINGTLERSSFKVNDNQTIFDTLRNSTDLARNRSSNTIVSTWYVSISNIDWRNTTLPVTVSSLSPRSSAVVQFVTSDDANDGTSKKSYIGLTSKPTDSVQVTVTSVSRSRIVGTFRANLYRESTNSTVRVTDGSFDLPIRWSTN